MSRTSELLRLSSSALTCSDVVTLEQLLTDMHTLLFAQAIADDDDNNNNSEKAAQETTTTRTSLCAHEHACNIDSVALECGVDVYTGVGASATTATAVSLSRRRGSDVHTLVLDAVLTLSRVLLRATCSDDACDTTAATAMSAHLRTFESALLPRLLFRTHITLSLLLRAAVQTPWRLFVAHVRAMATSPPPPPPTTAATHATAAMSVTSCAHAQRTALQPQRPPPLLLLLLLQTLQRWRREYGWSFAVSSDEEAVLSAVSSALTTNTMTRKSMRRRRADGGGDEDDRRTTCTMGDAAAAATMAHTLHTRLGDGDEAAATASVTAAAAAAAATPVFATTTTAATAVKSDTSVTSSPLSRHACATTWHSSIPRASSTATMAASVACHLPAYLIQKRPRLHTATPPPPPTTTRPTIVASNTMSCCSSSSSDDDDDTIVAYATPVKQRKVDCDMVVPATPDKRQHTST